MNIVVLGGNGQVGWELQRALAPLGDVTALGRDAGAGLCGDLECPGALRATLQRLRPHVIANAAAYTDVDGAETEPERAHAVNAEGARIVAAEAKRLDAWLVHYSTDYVFDGSGTEPWKEEDAAAPLNVYGQTKWHGEQAVRDTGCRHLIFRTQWVYSSRRSNFVRTLLRAAAEQDTLEVVGDQAGAPTGAELVADVTAHALRSAAARQALSGTYHLAARGETTRDGYARFVVENARGGPWPARLSDTAIVAVESDSPPASARRPSNSRLDVGRLERTFGLCLPDWRSGVLRVLAELGERTAQ